MFRTFNVMRCRLILPRRQIQAGRWFSDGCSFRTNQILIRCNIFCKHPFPHERISHVGRWEWQDGIEGSTGSVFLKLSRFLRIYAGVFRECPHQSFRLCLIWLQGKLLAIILSMMSILQHDVFDDAGRVGVSRLIIFHMGQRGRENRTWPLFLWKWRKEKFLLRKKIILFFSPTHFLSQKSNFCRRNVQCVFPSPHHPPSSLLTRIFRFVW